MKLQNVEVIFCTFRDITKRIQLESQSREIQAKLIQANKMTSLGLMVSGIAHEINNPNSFILTNAQLLEKAWCDALKVLHEYQQAHGEFLVGGLPFSAMEQHIPEMVSGIVDGSQRITGIISDLKRYVRQDRRAEMRDTDVNKAVLAAVAILQNQIAQHTEHFNLELEEHLPLVRGNGQQLGQIFINLLLNACQALPNPRNGVALRTRYDAAARQVIVEIHDEGEGIPPELGKRIMDPFFTTRLDQGGTGLGLFISQAIIKEHDGSLEFASEPGKGTTFFIRLPSANTAPEEHT
jgi:C4-dicarboxylate-specific signal transduction histidine kinase